jgi:multidrug efflux pump subunit AcrB
MEKKFEQLDHFDKVVTYARQGYGGMTITVKGGTSHADQREAWYQARKKFSDLKLELPDGVDRPDLQRRVRRRHRLLYAVKGDGVSQWELSDVAEDIKRRLLKVPMVKKVDVIGKQAKKVYVEFSNERLAALGVTPLMIAESLRNQNSVLRAARSTPRRPRDGARERPVHEPRRHPQRPDLRRRPPIKLGDVATVSRGHEDPPLYTVRHNGQQVIMLGIVMTDDGNIVDLGKGARGAIAKVQAELPYGSSSSAWPTSPRSSASRSGNSSAR